MYKKVFASSFLAFLVCVTVSSQQEDTRPLVESKDSKWADSVFHSLTPDERLGQLFMVAAYSNENEGYNRDLEMLVSRYGVGGLVFFQGSPVKQARLTNRFQAAAKVPLMIGMDAETGLGMRLDSTISYPKQMTLGAISNNDYLYKLGAEIARQSKRMGVHVNFAPVVDINTDPNNSVIGMRSFGEQKENVAAKGVALMLGMQHNGIIASAKHFPGHGDTRTDSHASLPVIHHAKQRLSDVELYPFRKLIADSLMGMMVGHLHVPVYDNTENLATSLSRPVVTDLLQKELGFRGLVFTDALNMKAVTRFYKPGDVDVMALLAGNDILLMSEDVPEALKKIKRAVKSNQIKQADLDARVKKILRHKYWAGLHAYTPIELTELTNDLNNAQAQLVKRQLYEQSITLVKTKSGLLPFRELDTLNFASVSVELEKGNEFQQTLSKYAPFQHYSLAGNLPEAEYERLVSRLESFKVVVVSLHNMNNSATKAYGMSQQSRTMIERLRNKTNVVVVAFGNPYSLKYFDRVDHLLCAYEDNEMTRQIVPQAIFGALPVSGRLPVSPDPQMKAGTGVQVQSLQRLAYSVPESVGMNSAYLQEIDYIVAEAIADKAMPGCQILVAKNGKIVFNKPYGTLAYDPQEPVTTETIYDLASVTKVASTLQAVMFLHERELLDVNKKIATYLPELKGTNKENMLVRDILMHQAGLVSYIPYWEKTRTKTGLNPVFYQTVQNDNFSLEVMPGMYSTAAMQDSIWKWTVSSPLLRKSPKEKQYPYVYSDLGFIMLRRVAEKLLNQSLEDFMRQNFYEPMGLQTLTYNPLCKFSETCIAPTEQDKIFRQRLVRGTVHDQSAAMMGGIAGHAGLFSNANDLAVLMQMNLQKGYYGGRRYLQEPTLPTFTKTYSKTNRRGLGWDKARPEGGGMASDFASRNSYGHSGFTGTFAWVDPDEELVYIFLSNRVYPSVHNDKLMKNAVRKRVQDVVYKSIINFQAQDPNLTVHTTNGSPAAEAQTNK